MKSVLKWISTDGLLHLLVCCCIMLSLSPIWGIWIAIAITLFIALLKEAYDFFIEKDNNMQQVLHDLICDFFGILIALMIILLWGII